MESTALLTDKYEVTMLQAALQSVNEKNIRKADEKVVFELFARKLPNGRQYGVVAGTERAIKAVENFHFTDEQINDLAQDPIFTEETLHYLREFKFKGNITGYREGDLYFPYSPIITVEATFGEAVLLETVLLSIFNHDSAVASAAARMVQAGQGISIIEMGSRRTHEYSAVDAARAAYLVGFDATSNMEAGKRYGIPTTGTSAHAFSLAFANEKDAFQAQVNALGVKTTLLVDTYDIEQGIRNAIEVAGTELYAIRIDSGDAYEETIKARVLLDELGAFNTKIILSSDIDEYKIAELLDRNDPVPVDGIGAGTRVVTGSGHPTAGMVYKLVAIDDGNGLRSVAKKATGKASYGGRKYAWREMSNNNGYAWREIITASNDKFFANQYVDGPNKRTLQKRFIENGVTVFNPMLEESREFHKYAIGQLLKLNRSIQSAPPALTVVQN